MSKHQDERRPVRAPKGTGLLRFIYGTGLIALGACLGIVIGSLTETPRLLLERLHGPVQTLEIESAAQEPAPQRTAPLERFGELQEGKSPKQAKPSSAKPPVVAEVAPPPPLVPAAEIVPAPPVAAARPADPAPASPPESETEEAPAAVQTRGAVVQVASFVERKPADALVQKLKDSGFEAYVGQPAAENGRFRVRVRPTAGETAGDLAKRLRGIGFDTWATTE